MVRTSFPEIGAEHMLQSLTAGFGTNPNLPRCLRSGRYRMLTGPSVNPRQHCNSATLQHSITHPIRSALQQFHHIGLRTAEDDPCRPPSFAR